MTPQCYSPFPRGPSWQPTRAARPRATSRLGSPPVRKFILLTAAILLLAALPAGARAQTDEIQIYDATIAEPGHFEATLHNNFAPDGLRQPAFPGGTISNHSWNGGLETAYGVADWWELGLYLPVYTYARDTLQFDGGKLRTLFVVPDAAHQTFFYGVNFELSINNKHWEDHSPSLEIRPILGLHLGKWDLIWNPIVDSGFNGLGHATFAPAERVAYNITDSYAVAVEHYAAYGSIKAATPFNQSYQELFAVADYKFNEANSVEFGAGFGLTRSSDRVLLKLIINHSF
jgi:hypothetical protein